MIPLVDIHCHLLAGLDDGPRTREDAVAMCRMAHGEGVRLMAATAHQSKRWPLTPQTILGAGQILEEDLRAAGIALDVFPSAEVMAEPETADHWQAGKLLGMGGREAYLLIEMPRGVFVEIGRAHV